jgi:hypothetical protein
MAEMVAAVERAPLVNSPPSCSTLPGLLGGRRTGARSWFRGRPVRRYLLAESARNALRRWDDFPLRLGSLWRSVGLAIGRALSFYRSGWPPWASLVRRRRRRLPWAGATGAARDRRSTGDSLRYR